MSEEGASQQPFPDTRWSLVLRTRGATAESRRALDEICRNYWRPLYAFARRRGQSPEEAEDATQEFLMQLLEKGTFEAIDTQRGKLRTFLLGAFQNFNIDQYRQSQSLKRGGGTTSFSLDTGLVESDIRDSSSHSTPDELFERQWALDLLDQALARLQNDYQESGRGYLFEALHPVLQGNAELRYQELGRQLEMREGAIKVAVHRLRQRFRVCLEQCVLETVGEENEVAEEMAFIRKVLSRA